MFYFYIQYPLIILSWSLYKQTQCTLKSFYTNINNNGVPWHIANKIDLNKVYLWNTMPPPATNSEKNILAKRSQPRSQGHWPWCHSKRHGIISRVCTQNMQSLSLSLSLSLFYGSKVIAKVFKLTSDRQTNRRDKNMPWSILGSIKMINLSNRWHHCIESKPVYGCLF